MPTESASSRYAETFAGEPPWDQCSTVEYVGTVDMHLPLGCNISEETGIREIAKGRGEIT